MEKLQEKELAQSVYWVVKKALGTAMYNHISAEAAYSSACTGAGMWRKCEDDHSDGGGMFVNKCPYDVDKAEAKRNECKRLYENWEQVMDYTINKLIDRIPDNSE